jgi:cyclopropane-fatty-acyl-phospholipid synthase
VSHAVSSIEVSPSVAEIRAHYDAGDEFFALWLDPEMIYSCALFEPDDSLAEAQVRKLLYHIAQSRAAGRKRVLDVGCGWGALLRLLAMNGVEQAVGLTLSESQADSIERAQVPGTRVLRESWTTHQPDEPYDAIISIGAFEHFVRQGLAQDQKLSTYRQFFEFCHRNLTQSGRLSLQTIAYSYRSQSVDPFVFTKIFPGSELPYPWEILKASEGLFEIVSIRNDRRDYERTCRLWAKTLARRRAEAVVLVGEVTTRDYERYLAIAAAAFKVGTVSLMRLVLERVSPEARASRVVDKEQ